MKFRCKPIDAVAKNILLVQQIEEGLTVGIDGKTGTVLDGTRVIFSASEPFHVLDKLSLNEAQRAKDRYRGVLGDERPKVRSLLGRYAWTVRRRQ